MIKKFLNDALKDPSVVKKLKEQGYKPEDIKSKKSFLAIINNSGKFDVQQMSIVTKKRKGGPGGGGNGPRISKLDLILKRLDTVDTFIEQQTKFNTKVDLFIDEQRKFNDKVDSFIVEQRKFNTKQEEFNNRVVKSFKKNGLKFY